MRNKKAVHKALDNAWHTQSAQASLERWFEVCDKEGWGSIPDNIPLLVALFGASWYFTRFIFYRGREAAVLIDQASGETFTPDNIRTRVAVTETGNQDPEARLESLRCIKNDVMLQILANHLDGRLDQMSTEHALTTLADITLESAMSIFGLHQVTDCRVAALGMGRMAGYEMTFGSDLDLIFLFETDKEESVVVLSKKIRQLLRHLSSASSSGMLYEVDMRLRPHGTSGALLTSTRSFLDYHQADREIWERQMMTRCRTVCDEDDLGEQTLAAIRPYVYSTYDQQYLQREVIAMRNRVQSEKGRPRGKIEIKRGTGGIMDIDFITHFLQLGYGNRYPQLITASTRQALQVLAEIGLLPQDCATELRDAYDFLKRVEACVRLFDMKPVSTIATEPEANAAVARAMGFSGKPEKFMEDYMEITRLVRREFGRILADG